MLNDVATRANYNCMCKTLLVETLEDIADKSLQALGLARVLCDLASAATEADEQNTAQFLLEMYWHLDVLVDGYKMELRRNR